MSNFATALRRRLLTLLFVMLGSALGAPAVLAQPRESGEAALKLPENHRNNTQRRLVADAFRANDPGAIEREATLAGLRKRAV